VKVVKDKRESERTKGERGGVNVHPLSFVSNTSFLFRSLSFYEYWLKFNKTWFFLTKHDFSWLFLDKTCFLFPTQLCVLKRIKSLRKSVQLWLFPARLVLSSCTGKDPTACIHYYLCVSDVSALCQISRYRLPRRLAKYCNGTSSLIHYITGIRSSTTHDRCSIYSTSCIYITPVQVCPRHCSTG
jgi:hypothetical protein